MCEMQHNSDTKNEKYTRINKKLKRKWKFELPTNHKTWNYFQKSGNIWGNALFHYLFLECRKQTPVAAFTKLYGKTKL